MSDAAHPVETLVCVFSCSGEAFFFTFLVNQSAKQNLGSNVIVITVTEVGHIRFNANWQHLSEKTQTKKKRNSLAVSYLILEISNHLCSNCRRGRQKAAKFLSMSRWEILKIMTTCAKYSKQIDSRRVKLFVSPEWGINTHMLFMGRTDSKQCLF